MKKTASLIQYTYLLFLAVITACGDAFFRGDSNGAAALAAKILIYYFLFYAFFLLAEKALVSLQKPAERHGWYQVFQYNRKNVLRISLLLFAVYFAYLLVFYPGATTGDTVYQIEDLFTGTSPIAYPVNYGHTKVQALMIDHHPVTTTLIFTFFYRIGLLLGDANIGLFLYNLLQSACMSILFASIVCYMDSLGIPKPIALISTVFYASPVVASYAVTMGKDMLFSFWFVLYYLVFFRIATNPNDEGSEKKQWVLLAVLSVLIALMNKKGMYLALLSNLCLLLVVPGKMKINAVVTALLPVFILAVVMQQILFPLLNIMPGGKQEILGTAFQQTALSLIEHPEKYTEGEKQLFFTILDCSPEELAEVYSPTCTDPVKNRFRLETDNSVILSYLKMWARHFICEPGTYIRAIFSVNGGYYAPLKGFNVYQYVPYSEVLNAFSQPDRTASLRITLGAFLAWLENIPAFSVFCQDSFYTFWYPAFSLYLFCKKKQRKKIILLSPLAGNLLFLTIGPLCYTRYALCQIYTFPVLLAVTAGAVQEKKEE